MLMVLFIKDYIWQRGEEYNFRQEIGRKTDCKKGGFNSQAQLRHVITMKTRTS